MSTTPTVLSFVGKSFAQVGFHFYFMGSNPRCPENCKYFTTCMKNLQPHKVYKIMEVMDRELECPENFHDEKMILVRVDHPLIEISLHNRDVYEGSVINFEAVHCDQVDCPNIDYCEPSQLLIPDNTKVKLSKIKQKIDFCPRSFHLSLVEIERKE